MKSLETQRLLLRSWQESDAGDLFAYARSSQVGPMAGWKPHETVQESLDIIKRFQQDDETWAVCDRTTGQVIGSIGLHPDSRRSLGKDRARMLGYVLGEAWWGRGLMAEACQAVIRFAFAELAIDILSVCHFPDNRQSRRVIEKLGFQYEGTLRMAGTIYDQTVVDSVCYSMTRQEYERQPWLLPT